MINTSIRVIQVRLTLTDAANQIVFADPVRLSRVRVVQDDLFKEAMMY